MKGKKEKKDYDQNIGLHEVFLESGPTALIIIYIWVKACKNILITQLGVNLIIFYRVGV